MEQKDVVIIGGGPAGLAAAVELHKQGIRNMIILEREAMLGGILRQCIHDGFGLGRFGESLSGPEYAQAFIDEVNKREIPYETSATVLSLTADRVVTASTRSGLRQYQAKAVVLAMGCKERSRGALGIPGERPAGVFTAGTAQAYMNLYNRMPGKEVIILGSGDIGMIMARRMTLEGAHVQAVFELMPYPSGLPRNIVQCLDDYNIPLYLSHTVTEIHGRNRLTGVTISEVDANRRPIPGTEKEYKCDTLILSVGLIPENKLLEDAGIAIDPHTNGAFVDENLQTNVPGVFSAGNVLHVHDLVDFVSMESEALARHAAAYVEGKGIDPCTLDVKCGEGVGHTIPQKVSGKNDFSLSLRVRNHYRDCRIVVRQNGVEVAAKKMKKAIPAEIYIPFIVGHFERRNRSIAAVDAEKVYALFQGHTYYIQKTFNESFADTPEGDECTLETIRAAIDNMIASNDTIFREILSNVPEKQKELLYAIAREGEAERITSADFIKRHSLTSASSVQSAAKKLLEKDLITEINKVFSVTDRLFAMWINKLYGKNPDF